MAGGDFNCRGNIPDDRKSSQKRRLWIYIADSKIGSKYFGQYRPEAYGRQHKVRGSLTETQSHLEYAKMVGYFDGTNFGLIDKRLESLQKDLNKLIRSLKS